MAEGNLYRRLMVVFSVFLDENMIFENLNSREAKYEGSFSDAEVSEEDVQHILAVSLTENLAYLPYRISQQFASYIRASFFQVGLQVLTAVAKLVKVPLSCEIDVWGILVNLILLWYYLLQKTVDICNPLFPHFLQLFRLLRWDNEINILFYFNLFLFMLQWFHFLALFIFDFWKGFNSFFYFEKVFDIFLFFSQFIGFIYDYYCLLIN